MGRAASGAVFAVIVIAVIVGVDVLLLRDHFRARLIVNVVLVLAAATIYLAFFRRR